MSDKDPKVVFASGATSSAGHDYPYWLMTHCAEKRGSLRFGHGNKKHENSTTVLAEANWLQAFHERDLEFFRNRYVHARDHMDNEMQGLATDGPGGNWGGVMWFLDVICFVEENDPEFYKAIQGKRPHPGKREHDCRCPRCAAHEPVIAKSGPETWRAKVQCGTCRTLHFLDERHACYHDPSIGAAFPPPNASELSQVCGRCGRLLSASEFGCNLCGACYECCKDI